MSRTASLSTCVHKSSSFVSISRRACHSPVRCPFFSTASNSFCQLHTQDFRISFSQTGICYITVGFEQDFARRRRGIKRQWDPLLGSSRHLPLDLATQPGSLSSICTPQPSESNACERPPANARLGLVSTRNLSCQPALAPSMRVPDPAWWWLVFTEARCGQDKEMQPPLGPVRVQKKTSPFRLPRT